MARIAGIEIRLDENSPLLSTPPPTVWVDSSVFIDFWSHISFDKNRGAGDAAIAETLRNMQLANWLAIALDELRSKTLTLEYEVWGNQMSKKAAPGSPEGIFPTVVAHVVTDHVCPGWDAKFEKAGETVSTPVGLRKTTNNERDQLMIDWCMEFGLDFISRDKKALKRARRMGLKPWRPDEFAERIISLEVSRARFMERLNPGIQAFISKHGHSERMSDNVCMIWNSYQGIFDQDLWR